MSDKLKEIARRLREIVASSTKNERTDWQAVEQTMRLLYPHEHSTKEKWRSLYRWSFNDDYQRTRMQAIARRDDKRMNRFTTNERLLHELKKPRSLEYLVYRLGVDEETVLSEIMRLQLSNYNIATWTEDGKAMFHNTPRLQYGDKDFSHLQKASEFKIAILSDTHLGSNQNALKELKDFYEYAVSKGVTDFYHAGDMTDGWYKHRESSIFDQHAIGFQQQLNYVTENYPRYDNVTTYFITGNHDATHTMNGGANIGEVISKIREDLVYLGHNFAKIWLTEGVDLNLIHPNDGVPYSISHKGQQIVDKAEGKRKARMIAVGHYHKAAWLPNYRGTDIYMMGSFQHQTPFMQTSNIVSYVGGYIVTLRVDKDGKLISATPEYVSFGGE